MIDKLLGFIVAAATWFVFVTVAAALFFSYYDGGTETINRGKNIIRLYSEHKITVWWDRYWYLMIDCKQINDYYFSQKKAIATGIEIIDSNLLRRELQECN